MLYSESARARIKLSTPSRLLVPFQWPSLTRWLCLMLLLTRLSMLCWTSNSDRRWRKWCAAPVTWHAGYILRVNQISVQWAFQPQQSPDPPDPQNRIRYKAISGCGKQVQSGTACFYGMVNKFCRKSILFVWSLWLERRSIIRDIIDLRKPHQQQERR